MLHEVRGAFHNMVKFDGFSLLLSLFKYVTSAFFFSFSPDFFSCTIFSVTVLTLKMLAATVSIAHPEQSDEKAVQM